MRAVWLWIAGLLMVAVAGCGVSGRRELARPDRLRPRVAHAVSGCLAREEANLSAVSFPAADVGWAVATASSRSGASIGSEILGTRDAGARWECQWRGSLAPVQLVATDAAHAWMLGWRGSGCTDALDLPHCRSVVLASGDGAHWSVVSVLGQGVSQLAFASPTLGLAAARDRACTEPQGLPPVRCAGRALLTVDGGRHWRAVLRTADPIVAVAVGRGALWAVESRLGVVSKSSGRRPGLIVLASRDDGRSWRTVGRIGLWLAGLRERVRLVVGRRAGLWLSVFDQDGCAMHGCSPDDLWRSGDGGLRWTRSDPVDRALRSRPPECGLAGPVPFAVGGAGSLWAAESLPTASCEGPAATLFRRSAAGRWTVARSWASFSPTELAWPTPSVGYILGPTGLERSTNAGRTWTQVLLAPQARLPIGLVIRTRESAG